MSLTPVQLSLAPLLFRLCLLLVSLAAVFTGIWSAKSVLSELTLPVRGVAVNDLRDSFSEQRPDGRRHEAVDIPAPRGTEVLAVADGVVQRLTNGDSGGLGLFLWDERRLFCFYYGHLDHYAHGLAEGASVSRGEVIGFVGSSGNAEGPHLHFSVHSVEGDGCSSDATVNPYQLFRERRREVGS